MAGKKKSKKSSRKVAGCKTTVIQFKTKRGKKIAFDGRVGESCGPRPKPSTRHLKQFQVSMTKAAKACKGTTGKGRFQACVSRKFESVKNAL